jgi:hypothetical protein
MENTKCFCDVHLSRCCASAMTAPDIDYEAWHFDPESKERINALVLAGLKDSATDIEIAEWLLWTGDDDIRSQVVHHALCTSKSERHRNLATASVYAYVFSVKTSCGHTLPRPYSNCKCNFTNKHHETLLHDLKQANMM